MGRDLKVFFLAIGLPALLLALGGLRLLQGEELRLRENDRRDLCRVAEDVAERLADVLPAFVAEEVAAVAPDSSAPAFLDELVASAALLRGAFWSDTAQPTGDFRVAMPFDGGEKPFVHLEVEPLALLLRMPELLAWVGADYSRDESPRTTIAELWTTGGTLLMPSSIKPRGRIYGEAQLGAPFSNWTLRLYRRDGDAAIAADAGRLTMVGLALIFLLFSTLVAGGILLLRDGRRAHREALRQTDFVTNVSHEFKTPLTTICLCAELAASKSISDEKRAKALKAISLEADRLKRMVLSVLDFRRLERGVRSFDFVDFDAAADVRDIAESMCALFDRHGLSIAAAGPLYIRADRDAFAQVVVNLLENAAKYAAAFSPVEISAIGVPSGGIALVSVSDRGPGLSPADLAHVFDKFWRADNSVTRETGGNGLGLALARGLARGMGGEVVAVGRRGGGLEFRLSLPLSETEGGGD